MRTACVSHAYRMRNMRNRFMRDNFHDMRSMTRNICVTCVTEMALTGKLRTTCVSYAYRVRKHMRTVMRTECVPDEYQMHNE